MSVFFLELPSTTGLDYCVTNQEIWPPASQSDERLDRTAQQEVPTRRVSGIGAGWWAWGVSIDTSTGGSVSVGKGLWRGEGERVLKPRQRWKLLRASP